MRAELPRPEVALQELDAQFVDTGGATIFPLAALLIGGEPHPDDFPCQAIGLAIDGNSGKGGPDRDGCAAVIFALIMPKAPATRPKRTVPVLVRPPEPPMTATRH